MHNMNAPRRAGGGVVAFLMSTLVISLCLASTSLPDVSIDAMGSSFPS